LTALLVFVKKGSICQEELNKIEGSWTMVETNEMPEPAGKSDGAERSQTVQQDQKGGEISRDARMWAMFCHLAGLAWFLIPLIGNIVAPLIVWQIKKEDSMFMDEHGKEALNFQISMSLYALISIPLFLICIGPFLLIAVVIFDLIFLLIAAIKANNGDHFRYPLCIRFIK
jgi:uncharacterized Tic20 family protein